MINLFDGKTTFSATFNYYLPADQFKFASLLDGTSSKLTLKAKENFRLHGKAYFCQKKNRTTMMGKKSFEGKWLGFCDGMFHRF